MQKKGVFHHTDFKSRYFGVIRGKPGLILGLKCTLMDAIGRQISITMTSGLLGLEKQGGFPEPRNPDITFGSHGRR